MRLPTTVLALATILTLAGCGDEPEATPNTTPTRPAPAQRPAVDTMAGDSAGAAARRGGTNPSGAPAGGGQAAEGETEDVAAPTGTGRSDAAPVPSGARLYTVQVAAFTSPDSAQKWTGRLASLDLPVWTSVAELGGVTYYRVRVGAVSSVSDARRLGGLLSDRFEWPVWVAPITPADPMPGNAVAATREVLRGD